MELIKAFYSIHLSVLSEVVVQQLGVGLLVWRQDVKEGSRSVTRGTAGVQGARPTQGRRQVERRRRPCVEALLVKRLGEQNRRGRH